MSDDPTRPTGCAPVFYVADLETSLAFYQKQLGFDVAFTWGEPLFYGGVCRGDVTIHLNADAPADRPPGGSSLCVFVPEAQAVHDELVGRDTAIHVAIDDRPYGMRDFSVADPDGNVVIFGNDLGGS